ncbi:hypothetical protein C922_00568 [Plasmodium inui San Antonio 1]|uniref:MINDY deubiquitinase domain-containing protein n=1 Tax=Plasmodium inui San Antonio 1 TaxID=1237626 RepID=W7AAW9_9APIC|nr:hypothetical protein C922_00568 [Plasmodium inui San Antonio 1]EUD68880.1 hypothetical protein C922_00568 [Plasmodium inui San Antonio 1]
MTTMIKLHYDENNDEEENMIIRCADYETFKSYVLKKYDKIYEIVNYENENINYYSVKWINFINRRVPILLQNKSGPCPLLCIANILLLRNQLQIDKKIKKISQSFLESKIMHILLESNKKNVTDNTASCNYRKNIIECVDILPQLKYGLDVNCKFTNIHSFEYTKGLCIFDMLNIPLYHGWVISSDDVMFYSYLKDYSYNVIINKIVRYNEYYERKKKKNADESSNEKTSSLYQLLDVKEEKRDDCDLGKPCESDALMDGPTNNPGEASNSDQKGVPNDDTVNLAKGTSKSTEKIDKKKSINGIPIFPDDLDQISEENFKATLYQDSSSLHISTVSTFDADTTKKKNTIFGKKSTSGGACSSKRRTHSNVINLKQPSSIDLEKGTNKYRTETGPKSDEFFVKQGKTPSNLASSAKKNNANRNATVGANVNISTIASVVSPISSDNSNSDNSSSDESSGDVNMVTTPKFPEDPLPTTSTSLIPIEYFSEGNIQGRSKKSALDEKAIRNNELFMESNKIASLTSETANADIADNCTENSENFIMKNYNTDIDLTPYEIHEAIIISEFLETYKTQLTLVGLKLLRENLNPNQLVAFFRNNHFNTLFKYENKLFLLAADISFLHLSCTWELFDNVDNDTSYYDNNFRCLSNQKNLEKNLNRSIIYLRNYDRTSAKNNTHCVKSNTSLSNSKKKKKKCTFM